MDIRWDKFPRGKFVKYGEFHILKLNDAAGEVIENKCYNDHFIAVYRYTTPRGKIVGYRIESKLDRPIRSIYKDEYAAFFTSDKSKGNKLHKPVLKDQFFWLVTYKSGRYTNYLAISRIRDNQQLPIEEDEEKDDGG